MREDTGVENQNVQNTERKDSRVQQHHMEKAEIK